MFFRRLRMHSNVRARQSIRALVKRTIQGLILLGLYRLKGDRWSMVRKRRRGRATLGPWIAVCLSLCPLALAEVLGAEPFKKMRIAIPSIVIDFAPLWIAREKGIFREEGIDVELTFIQGNIRVVQALIAGEVQAGIAGSAGPISGQGRGRRHGHCCGADEPFGLYFCFTPAGYETGRSDGEKVGIGAVGGSDEVATRIASGAVGC